MLSLFFNLAYRVVKKAKLYNRPLFIGKHFVKKKWKNFLIFFCNSWNSIQTRVCEKCFFLLFLLFFSIGQKIALFFLKIDTKNVTYEVLKSFLWKPFVYDQYLSIAESEGFVSKDTLLRVALLEKHIQLNKTFSFTVYLMWAWRFYNFFYLLKYAFAVLRHRLGDDAVFYKVSLFLFFQFTIEIFSSTAYYFFNSLIALQFWKGEVQLL